MSSKRTGHICLWKLSMSNDEKSEKMSQQWFSLTIGPPISTLSSISVLLDTYVHYLQTSLSYEGKGYKGLALLACLGRMYIVTNHRYLVLCPNGPAALMVAKEVFESHFATLFLELIQTQTILWIDSNLQMNDLG